MTMKDALRARKEDLNVVKSREAERAKADSKSLKDFGVVNEIPIREIEPFQLLAVESARKEGPAIKVYEVVRTDCPNCYLVGYNGPLYEACGGFCKPQGYTVLIRKDGTVDRFLASTLIVYVGRSEIIISPDVLKDSLLPLVNNLTLPVKQEAGYEKYGNQLGSTLKILREEKQTESDKHYAATMSRLSGLWGAGNSVGSFVDHIGLVRKEMKLGTWPTLK